MTDESGKGTQAPTEFEALSKLIKEYHEAAQETDKRVIELLEKMVSCNIRALDVSLDNANLNFNQIIKSMTEIKISLGEIIFTKKEPIPSVFWLKVGLAIGIPTLLNVVSIIMNLSGIRLFYW